MSVEVIQQARTDSAESTQKIKEVDNNTKDYLIKKIAKRVFLPITFFASLVTSLATSMSKKVSVVKDSNIELDSETETQAVTEETAQPAEKKSVMTAIKNTTSICLNQVGAFFKAVGNVAWKVAKSPVTGTILLGNKIGNLFHKKNSFLDDIDPTLFDSETEAPVVPAEVVAEEV